MKLHGYFRSSAVWRVRTVLALKGLTYAHVFHHLRKGEQSAPDYLRLNPQGLIPALETDDGAVLTQSLAICEYLDEVYPAVPLLPSDPVLRAKVRAFSYAIACEIHPLQNLKILKRLKGLGFDQAQTDQWAQTVIADGFDACERLLDGQAGPYAFGEAVTLADVCLVPQMSNARRFGVTLRWPRLQAVEAACLALPAFQAARPEAQPDFEG
ncbi:maleylacetoacetate isomerase [Asticcacaulis sp. BYS171W]|uniref:Maleylacetoacetate isomerase n=1 Tax=Asticcacaulis aquaticus TaxID=2984212 RepID=A0ABT5HYG8_9CAUL|nr:maleylacetoacetate isomerase [Asticcacaulis aquaticus]MDC7684875.1 maleylacetoacetate isomerase [Asticcacaulis aquaticus]